MTKELTGYRFLDKDPIVDVYREALRKSGKDQKDIAEMGGPVLATLKNWDKGETKKPQRLSMAFAMMALGYHEQWANPMSGDILTPRFKGYPEANKKVISFVEAFEAKRGTADARKRRRA